MRDGERVVSGGSTHTHTRAWWIHLSRPAPRLQSFRAHLRLKIQDTLPHPMPDMHSIYQLEKKKNLLSSGSGDTSRQEKVIPGVFSLTHPDRNRQHRTAAAAAAAAASNLKAVSRNRSVWLDWCSTVFQIRNTPVQMWFIRRFVWWETLRDIRPCRTDLWLTCLYCMEPQLQRLNVAPAYVSMIC